MTVAGKSPTGRAYEDSYKMFDKIIKQTVNQLVQGISPKQEQFRDLLSCQQTGKKVQDWELLLIYQPSSVSNLSQFQNDTRLFYSDEVANFNHNQLTKLHQPN